MKKTYTQSQHRAINAREYPGTRQICVLCDEPTGRCEDDGLWVEEHDGWVCPECYDEQNKRGKTMQVYKEINDLKQVPNTKALARQFVKGYARAVWLSMVADHLENKLDLIARKNGDRLTHSEQLVDDIEWVEEAIFNSWQGQNVQAIYYQLQDKKVALTKGNDLWHQDETFRDVVLEVVLENPVDFIEVYGRK